MAYAAITSLMSTIQQSVQFTGCNLQQFYEKLESLRAILQKPWKVTDDLEALKRLEAEITAVAFITEDTIDFESRNVFLAKNRILRRIAIWKLHFLLKRAVGRVDSIMKQWIGMLNSKDVLKSQNLTLSSTSQHVLEPEDTMVGHEKEFEMMQDRLIRGESELEIVSIVGMGGIGKTTLANRIYSDPFIMSRFDVRAKTTVSQEYCARNVLQHLLSTISGKTDECHDQQDDGQLADRLQKLLKGRRYLIVIDDIWTKGAWDDIRLCFPDSSRRSRVLMTTRNMEVAEYASLGKPPYQMRLMNFDESWSLLREKIPSHECFSLEFEQLGKQIALKCGGLPLAIVVIAGLLSKIGTALDEWRSIAENVSSAVSTDVDVQCMRVLALSYHHLPRHLKACFLYFAIFPEDEVIFVDKLLELWVVEGFLKADETKSIEEVAEKCLNDLIGRNLISIHDWSLNGKIKSCGMHDVTRELCLREARNMNFVNVIGGKNDPNPNAQSMHAFSKSRGRISIQNGKELSRCRKSEAHSVFLFYRYQGFRPELLRFKRVRVLDLALMKCSAFPSSILDLIHLRYLALTLSPCLEICQGKEIPSSVDIPPSISTLRYLQTFILKPSHPKASRYPFLLSSEILAMPQLRHLCLDWSYLLFNTPIEKSLAWKMKDLQCLSGLNPVFCTWPVLSLLPNLKKLHVYGIREDFNGNMYYLYDFRYLHQLEELEFYIAKQSVACSLEIIEPSSALTSEEPLESWTPKMKLVMRQGSTLPLPHIYPLPPLIRHTVDAFPQNLKNLALRATSLRWEDIWIIGMLPKLESLKLAYDACIGDKWLVVEDGFPRLKFLILKRLGIRCWRAKSRHFPSLERLYVKACWCLDSIPQDFSEITTLELIDICGCAQSIGNSAKQIQQSIEDNYASSVEVHIS